VYLPHQPSPLRGLAVIIIVMSLRGRYIIDRMKRAVGNYLSFPVPPYQDPNFWESVYQRLEPSEVFEWGKFSADDIGTYRCRCRSFAIPDLLTRIINRQHDAAGWLPDPKATQVQLTIRDMLGLPAPNEQSTVLAKNDSNEEEEPILVLGCGNSRLGEQLLLDYGCRGPILHVDASSRVIHDMTLRNKERLHDLIYVQDDAAVLSALGPNAVLAAVDKGTIDAIFCTDDYETCWSIVQSAHRVLRNGGVLSCFSFSRPEFILPKILLPSEQFNNPRHLRQLVAMWDEIQVQQLDFIFLYRFIKTTPRPVQSIDLRKRPARHHHQRQ
jgi:SAM-dependent methyltransferase